MQVRIQDLHLTIGLNIPGGYLAGACGVDVYGLDTLAVELCHNALHIEDNLRHIFLNTGNGGELMLDAGDLDGGRSRAGQ